MKIYVNKIILLASMLFFSLTLLKAQAVIVRSFAEPGTIGRDEQVTYTIEVTGQRGFTAQAPKLPPLSDFSLMNMVTSTASNFSIINGNVSESVTKSFIYRLLPNKTGNLKIPAFNIDVSGRLYSTQQVNIRVLDISRAGTRTPNQGNPYASGQNNQLYMMDPFNLNPGFEPIREMDIVAIPEKKVVYVGEPVLVTYRLYTTQPVSSLELKDEKDFGGYGKEVYSEPTRLNFEATRYKDRRYQTALLKTVAISPNRTGSLQLPQLTANAQVGNIGLFAQTLQSQPAFITVKELPVAGKPRDFYGAVGSFKVSDNLKKSQIRMGEALEYKLVITGRGNFNQFSNPDYPSRQDFRIASPSTENRLQGGISGSRTITYLLIPKREGSFVLPGVSFNWFNPVSGRYEYYQSPARKVTVKPGTVLTYLSNVFQKENTPSLTAFNPRNKYVSQPIVVKSTLYWLAILLIMLSIIPSWLYARTQKLKDVDPDLAAQKGSNRVLKKYLKQAEAAAAAVSQEFYPKAEQGLMHYLSDKYHISHRYSTQEKIYQLMLRGLDNELIEQLEAFLKRCQEARFKPGGYDSNALDVDLDALKDVIRAFIKQT